MLFIDFETFYIAMTVVNPGNEQTLSREVMDGCRGEQGSRFEARF
jgi:hypothetical protein